MSRRSGKRKHPWLDTYWQHLREVNRVESDRSQRIVSGIEIDHMLRKYRMGAEAFTVRGRVKLVGYFILDLFKAMVFMVFMRLVMVLCILAGWALVALFIWFLIFY